MKTKIIPTLLILAASPLMLLASSATDRKIEESAKTSYNYRTVLEDNVTVKAKDGVVTLTGTVQDKDDRALAADTVENIPGVTCVNNEIVVKSTYPEHSDGWIALKIRSRLLVKSNVSATSTKVNVQDGVVTLTGTADNIAQKELTAAYAKDIDHVKSVNNDIVVIEPAVKVATSDKMADKTASEKMGDKIDDASITTQVKSALLTHKSTSALKTKVTTSNGIVSVSGVAASDAEKSLVSKLAGDVRGVVSVTNSMTVKN